MKISIIVTLMFLFLCQCVLAEALEESCFDLKIQISILRKKKDEKAKLLKHATEKNRNAREADLEKIYREQEKAMLEYVKNACDK